MALVVVCHHLLPGTTELCQISGKSALHFQEAAKNKITDKIEESTCWSIISLSNARGRYTRHVVRRRPVQGAEARVWGDGVRGRQSRVAVLRLTLAQIKKSYRALSLLYHPDKNQEPGAGAHGWITSCLEIHMCWQRKYTRRSCGRTRC